MKTYTVKLVLLPVLLGALVFSSACEETITLDLDSAEPVLVIEGVVTGGPGPHYVSLTKTTDFYRPNEFPTVSGATVTLSDDEGNSETLAEVSEGLYESTAIAGVPGRTYTLTIEHDGREYVGVSTMPEPLEPDSLTFEYEDDFFGQSGYEVSCWFHDREDVEDFLRLKLCIDSWRDPEYYLYDDKLTDGESIDYSIWYDEVHPGSTVTLEFYTIDRPVYEYYSTLSLVVLSEDEGNGLDTMSQPGNPITNIAGGALGYFGAFTKRTLTVTVQ